MKICLNQRMQYLSEAFRKGELTLADYRELRREEFEQLQHSVQKQKPASVGRKYDSSHGLAKKILLATVVSVVLLFLTVMLVRWLF